MNKSFMIALGVLATVVFSLFGLVLIPNWQFRDLQPYKDDSGTLQPPERFGIYAQGREVYMDLGCIYCHSQQVRPPGFGADIDRNWGPRRSVARDYIYERPPLMGTMRTGPDLMNIAARQSGKDWHYLHLYDPQITSKGSVMPPFAFLFAKNGKGEGVRLPNSSDTIVPNERAAALVEYLRSLDHTYELPEAQ